MAARDPVTRALAARQAIHTRWARTSAEDRRAATQAARDARRRRLEDQVDPDRVLDVGERDRRVRSLVRAELAKASRLGVEARRRKQRAEDDDALDDLIEAETVDG